MYKVFLSLTITTLLLNGCSNSGPESQSDAGAETRSSERLQAGNIMIGDRLPDFELPDMDGNTIRLNDIIDGEHYVAVVWHSPACPCATNCMEAVRKKLSGPENDDLKMIGVVSELDQNRDWFRQDLQKQIDDELVTFPLVFDQDQSVMELYGAKRTPTVWLADKEGNVQFWGAPENTLYPGSTEHRILLKEAVEALRADKTPETVTEPPIGCLIATPKTGDSEAESEDETSDT